MRTVGLSAAVLAMSLAGPAFAAMDEKKKPADEQQGTQQQSTNKQQEAGQAATSSEAKNKAKDGSGATQPTETPEATGQSGSTGTQSGSDSEGKAAGSGNTTESPEAAAGQSGSTGTQSGSDSEGTAAGSGNAATGGDTTTGKVTEGQDIGSDANEQASLTAAQGKELIGKTLVGADDQQVGEINDVVVSDDGKLNSVLINVGGFLGIGDKTVAIPADTIEVQDDKVIARDLTKEAAENMSEYKAKGG